MQAFTRCWQGLPIAVLGASFQHSSSSKAWAVGPVGSGAGLHLPSCLAARDIFPVLGSNLKPLHWQVDSLTTGSGSPLEYLFYFTKNVKKNQPTKQQKTWEDLFPLLFFSLITHWLSKILVSLHAGYYWPLQARACSLPPLKGSVLLEA